MEKRNKKINVFKRDIYIPQLPKIEGVKTAYKDSKSRFNSPIFGSKIKDKTVVPYNIKRDGDYEKQMGVFRKEKITDEERIQMFGSKYHEFTTVITKQQRIDYYGENPTNIFNDDKQRKEETITLKPVENKVAREKNVNHLENVVKDEEEKIFQEPILEDDYIPRLEKDVEKVVEVKVSKPKPVIEKTERVYNLRNKQFFKTTKKSEKETPKWVYDQIDIIHDVFEEHKIDAKVVNSRIGPTVTRYEIEVESSTQLSRFSKLEDPLKMKLSVLSVRIETPIPGKPYVGLEIPNVETEIVHFGNVINDPKFYESNKPLLVALGENIDGENIFVDIAKMPHGLVAGATNSGKSVCINSILVSLILKNNPEDLKLILIDPKMVELSTYNEIPHLVTPVITDPKMAAPALDWAVEEMGKRYTRFSSNRVRNIEDFNEDIKEGLIDEDKMPYIVIVIDELADLMNVASQDIELSIQRLMQKARAAGIHLILATQRPTTDVIKGGIKSNIPTRIAFKVVSYIDSQTIIDSNGAETLLGRGDMLIKDDFGLRRLQGAYLEPKEIDNLTNYIRSLQSDPDYLFSHDTLISSFQREDNGLVDDDLLIPIGYFVIEDGKASTNRIINSYSIGFNRATSIVNSLELLGVVSEPKGTKARDVLVTKEEFDEIIENLNI